MPKAYNSSLSRAQFELIESLLPKAKPGGRPRSVGLFIVLNAILYVVVQGCKWRDIPGALLPWSTAYSYFRTWRIDVTVTPSGDSCTPSTRVDLRKTARSASRSSATRKKSSPRMQTYGCGPVSTTLSCEPPRTRTRVHFSLTASSKRCVPTAHEHHVRSVGGASALSKSVMWTPGARDASSTAAETPAQPAPAIATRASGVRPALVMRSLYRLAGVRHAQRCEGDVQAVVVRVVGPERERLEQRLPHGTRATRCFRNV